MSTSSTSNALTSTLSGLNNATINSSSSSGSSNSQVGGLLTAGQIDVSTLVSELMTIQDQPLTQIQNQESGIQAKLSAYGQLKSSLSSLQTAAQALTDPTAFQAASATVTGSGVSATVTGTPPTGNYSVTVSSLASAQSLASAAMTSTAAQSVGTGTLTFQLGNYSSSANTFTPQSGSSAITVNITSSNDSLSGIASAINSAAKGSVNASVVTDGSGNSRLVLTSANTGAANAFTVTGSSGLSQFGYDPTSTATQGMTRTQSAADASFSLNGLALTSSSNAVTTAISGVTLNLTQAPPTGSAAYQAQVAIGTDSSAVNTTINSFVTAYNSYVNLAAALTSYDPTSKTGSELTGDPTAIGMMQTFQSLLGSATTANGTNSSTSYLAQIGITFSTNGILSINTTTLDAALASNPSGVAAMFAGVSGSTSGQGFAQRISNTTQQMLSSSGAIGAADQGLNSQLTYLQNKATALQLSLNQTQNSLLQEYSQLNADVTAAQSEQVQIANEMANLPGG